MNWSSAGRAFCEPPQIQSKDLIKLYKQDCRRDGKMLEDSARARMI